MLASVCTERVDGSRQACNECLGGHAACDFARAMASHAVGEGKNSARRIGRNAVLVVLANVANVRQQRHFKEIVRHVSIGFSKELAQCLSVAYEPRKYYTPPRGRQRNSAGVRVVNDALVAPRRMLGRYEII